MGGFVAFQSTFGSMMGSAWDPPRLEGLAWGSAREPPRKRAKPSTQENPSVQKIKNYQRQGEEEKKTWWDFCDQQHKGVRDPARHPQAVLEEFCAQVGI